MQYTVEAQRRNLSAHAEVRRSISYCRGCLIRIPQTSSSLVVSCQVTSNLIDGLGASISDQSEAVFDYFTSSFDYFAGHQSKIVMLIVMPRS